MPKKFIIQVGLAQGSIFSDMCICLSTFNTRCIRHLINGPEARTSLLTSNPHRCPLQLVIVTNMVTDGAQTVHRLPAPSQYPRQLQPHTSSCFHGSRNSYSPLVCSFGSLPAV